MTATDADAFEPAVAPPRSTGKSTAAGLFAEPLVPMLTVLGVTILAFIAIGMARTSDMIAALWAANGLAAAVWLRSGRGVGYDLCFGGLMAFGILAGQFLAGNTPLMSAIFTLANMVEIVLAVVLARKFAPTLNLATVEGACRFIFCTAAVSPAITGLGVAACLSLMRGVAFLETFQTWWFGHSLGIAVVGSFVLSLDMRAVRAMFNPWRAAETALVFGLLIAVCTMIYFMVNMPLGFAMVPILIIIAARLRVLGVTAALVVISVMALGSMMLGVGPWHLVIGNLAERAMLLQLTILFGYLPILLVASLLEERDRLSARAKAGQLRAEKASAAKSRLLANVAHEIKSPIGGVIGIGDLWSSGQLGPVTETQAEMATMLVKTARQVEALSHDLLDVARAESGAVKVEMRPTDIPGILEDIRRTTAMRPESRLLSLKVICEGDGLVALADSQRLAQVVDNLATNAVKYGASGGEVLFRARRIYDGVRIEVSDKGPGLSPEKQAQLFEPFNRLGLERSTVEGHGIGLALAKRLVELQGGSIGVQSRAGEGATFWIELSAA
ncbi:sensor histidine kinase [Brevundimonas sp. NIBR11]|uniref:sensor histidine kinase n=1 Tax=Brevundimonas sp. NIBR11 TaxID=3015999 RepID=UPI0022F04ABC|nr:sensor histidine kinase [Brevundimonas sp. NIBR11]WGM30891.1 Adaptive-response sensory-kinase SasA [Brevundimonas sp. NIBR11]